MKLTIVVPVYRVEDQLDRCLTSIVGQRFTDFELILVDDGSPDRCPQMCDAWAERDERISVIHRRNGGLSAARNTGIEAARGEFITFVDSDDFIAADTYDGVMPIAEQHDITEYPLCWHYGSPGQQRRSFGTRVYSDMQDYWLTAKAYEHAYAWNKVFRRNLFVRTRFPEGRVFEDVAILPLLLRQARSVATIETGCYYYCCNADGITARATGRELTMLLESHLQVMDHWCDDNYYLHVLNIQTDVCEAEGCEPRLKRRFVNPLAHRLTTTQRLKAIVANTLGIKRLCRLNIIWHRLKSHLS